MFSAYGKVRDVYMPRDFHTRQPRGYAFVEFLDNRDAADAKHALDRSRMNGRDIDVIFAKVCVRACVRVCAQCVC